MSNETKVTLGRYKDGGDHLTFEFTQEPDESDDDFINRMKLFRESAETCLKRDFVPPVLVFTTEVTPPDEGIETKILSCLSQRVGITFRNLAIELGPPAGTLKELRSHLRNLQNKGLVRWAGRQYYLKRALPTTPGADTGPGNSTVIPGHPAAASEVLSTSEAQP